MDEYEKRRKSWVDEYEAKKKESDRISEWSKEIDEKIEKEMQQQEPKPEEIISENPPLPELDVIKFAMEKGNDEIALWLRHGKESGYLSETIIAIALMKYNCPMLYEDEYSCLFQSNSWKELFHHFKDMHYTEEAKIRHAKHLFYKIHTSRITSKTTEPEKQRIENEALNPTPNQLKEHLEHVENRTKWRDIAYAMLQECFVYEANTSKHRKLTSAKLQKKTAVLYRMQKTYGLTTGHIAKMFKLSVANTRGLIYSGMMHTHGNDEKNLPTWMQNALKQS